MEYSSFHYHDGQLTWNTTLRKVNKQQSGEIIQERLELVYIFTVPVPSSSISGGQGLKELISIYIIKAVPKILARTIQQAVEDWVVS